MQRHREWLKEFKDQVKQKKEEESLVETKAKEKFLKVLFFFCLYNRQKQILFYFFSG